VNFTTQVAFKQLLSRHSFGFISFSTILSILGLSIGVSALIITSCISKGFSNAINAKLSNIDGHIRITSYNSSPIPMEKIANLDSSIYTMLTNIEQSTAYIEKHVIIKNNDYLEGAILYGVPSESLREIFHLDKFVLNDFLLNDKNSIILGKALASKLNVSLYDTIIAFDVEGMSKNNFLKAEKLIVANIFETNFPEYDRLLAFTSFDLAQSFFNMGNTASGLIINIANPKDAMIAKDIISNTIIQYPYLSYSWNDRHNALLNWLKVYDTPIRIIIIFIAIIGIFNLAASLWMIIIEKNKEFASMQSMGLKEIDIKKIILKEGAIVGILGSFGGAVISLILLFLQYNFQFITLPDDVYFMNHLPVQLEIIYFVVYPFFTILIAILFSYFPARYSIKISPLKALSYE